MNRSPRLAVMFALAGLIAPATAAAGPANLGGSPSSMERQHEVAVAEDYIFLETPAAVREYAEEGRLERVTESADLALSNVSFPYVRLEVRMFIERIAAQYRAAVGDKLVVTSLTRPTALQPVNAHALSVHPAGMAVDFRVPGTAKARKWLERTLLELERAGVLDVTRERTPAHYHVAVYPAAYRAYVEGVTSAAAIVTLAAVPAPARVAVTAPTPASVSASSTSDTERAPRSPIWPLLASTAVGVAVFGARRIGRTSERTALAR